MQYQEGQILDGSDGQAYIVRNGVPTLMNAPAAAPSAVQVSGPDPKLALDRIKAQQDIAKAVRDAARAPVQAQTDQVQLQRQQLALSKEQSAGSGPAPARIPAAALAGIQENLKALRKVDKALREISPGTGRPQSIGPGTGFFGDTVTQYNDPDGTTTRASVGDIGATKIHDLSGAAVSPTEAPRFVPFVPKVTDRPEVARQKLESFREELVGTIQEQEVAYSPDNGYLPYKSAMGTLSDYLAKSGAPPKDERSDKTAIFTGSPADNNGDGGSQMGIAGGSSRTEADPVLKGVNAKINGMLKTGKSDQDIAAYLKQVGANASPASVAAALKFRRENPGYKGNYSVNLEDRAVPQSAARQAFQSLGAGPLGSYAVGAGDALTAGRLDNIAGAVGGNSAQVDAAKALLAKANPMSSLLGNVTGGALAAAGIEAGLAGSGLATAGGVAGRLARAPLASDVAYGAATGSDDPNSPLLGALAGGALGLGGGYLGQRVAGAVGGVRNEAVQRLRAAGIQRMTLGQALGQSGRAGAMVKGIEDRLSGLPFVGAMTGQRQFESLEDLNKIVLNQAAGPLAKQANPVNVAINATGPNGIDALREARDLGYANAVKGRSALSDAAYDADYQRALTMANAIPNTGPTLKSEIDAAVPGYFAARNINGENAQAAIKELKGVRRAHQTDALGIRSTAAVREAEGALTGLFERQSPGFGNDLARANETHTNLKTLEAAASAAANQRGGLMTPAQINRSSVQSANRLTGSGATTDRPFYQLAADAQEILPNKVPDSGTAGRLALAGSLVGGGAGVGYLGEDPYKGAAAGAAIAALQTQAAQRRLVKMVLDNPAWLRRASDYAVNNGIGGAIGGAGAVQALPYFAGR